MQALSDHERVNFRTDISRAENAEYVALQIIYQFGVHDLGHGNIPGPGWINTARDFLSQLQREARFPFPPCTALAIVDCRDNMISNSKFTVKLRRFRRVANRPLCREPVEDKSSEKVRLMFAPRDETHSSQRVRLFSFGGHLF